MREGTRERNTRETSIAVRAAIDEESGFCELSTGRILFDHMLGAFAVHGKIALTGHARSLDGLEHHLIEDVALVLGGALSDAVGVRAGVARFGSAYVPMDEALVRAVVDLSGRPYARIVLPAGRDRVEDLDTHLVPHFFRSLSATLGATLHVELLAGEDAHHIIEAAFKATARALSAAWATTGVGRIASTKGVLD